MSTLNNIFSIFDPSSSYISLTWTITLIGFILLNNFNFITTPNYSNSLMIFITTIINEVNELTNLENNLTNELIVNLFLIVILLNIVALIPYNFTPIAHISLTFTLSLSIWVSTILYGWFNEYNNSIIHLTPIGTPFILINFIVLIELISISIRPITLSVRLSANIVAGHLLIALLSNFSLLNNNNIVLSSLPIVALTILETIVAVVQAYVIITLLTLYQNETIN